MFKKLGLRRNAQEKKKWVKPTLLMLIRGSSQERTLVACKHDDGS